PPRSDARRAAAGISGSTTPTATIRAGSTGSWRLWIRYVRQSGAEAGPAEGERHRDHPPVGELLAVVPRRGPARRARRLRPGDGLHGDPAVRLRHLGADPAGLRQALQGDRPRERVLPSV